MSKFINGPVNTIRVEGKVNNIKKVLYIFFEDHKPLYYQTECPNIRSQDIKNYLIEQFDFARENNINVDFFMEILINDEIYNQEFKYSKKTKKYILKLREFVKNNFIFDDKTKTIKTSEEFPNTRHHYIDFRDIFLFDILFNTFDLMNKDKNEMWNYRYLDNNLIENIKKDILGINIRIKKLKEMILNDKYEKTENVTILFFHKILKKIKSRYKNKDIYQKITKYYLDNISRLMNDYEKISKEYMNYLHFLQKESNKFNYNSNTDIIITDYLPKFVLLNNKYQNIVSDIGVYIIDIYFLRRFLDKDYVKNACVYTGGYHSCNYLYFLVKYCGFTITHTSYVKKSIKNLTQVINKAKKYIDIENEVYPEEFVQCSDLSNFPKGFM